MNDPMNDLFERLDRIESVLQALVQERSIKEWYTTAEVAEALGKAEYTVREWCRLRRIPASKKPHARGAHQEWMISRGVLVDLQNLKLPGPPVAQGEMK